MVDRQAGIVDRRMPDAEGIDDFGPAEIVDGAGPVARSRGVELVDRHDLARLAGQEVLVVEAPVGGGVAAEGEAAELRIGTGPQRHVEDAHLEDIAGLGAAHRDRTGADMDAQPLAVALAGAAAHHALPVLGPEIDALGAGIALDHALMIVARLMGQRLDGDDVAGVDLELRLEVLAEVTPMDGVGIGRQVVMPRRRRDALRHRQSAGGQCRHAALGGELAGEEGLALARHVLLELPMVKLEVAAGRIVALAHGILLRGQRLAKRSISTMAPRARPVTPMQVRAGRRSGGK